MKQRIISGVVLFLLGAAVLLFNETFRPALNIVAALISAASLFELIKALGLEKKLFLSVPALITAAAAPFCRTDRLFALYFLFTAIMFTSLLAYHHETNFKEVAVLYSMAVMIPVSLRTLVLLRDLSEPFGVYYVCFAVLAAWMADVGAFFAGTFFGKHKLCPEISPKKTVEGAIGGLVFNVAVLMLFGWYVSAGIFEGAAKANYLALFLAGFLGTPISILGDLSFSIIKRSCHIKDFGQVIPGHGGILDRFDSVIFTAPYVYLLASFLPLLSL